MIQRRALLNLGLAGLLAGCQRYAPPLRVAYHPWSGYATLHLVRSLNWLAPEQWHPVDTGSATESVEKLRKGEVHAAALTLDELLLARSQGLPLQVVALLDQSVGADVVLGRPNVLRTSDLKGKRLGLEVGAVGQLMALNALASAGLRPQDVQQIPLPFDQHEAAWQAAEVDALVTFEPAASRLERAGAVRLYDSRDLPSDLIIADVLAMRTDSLPQQSDHLHHLVGALFKALHHFHSMPIDTQYRLADWLSLPPDKVLAAFRGVRLCGWAENREKLSGTTASLARKASQLADFMLKQGTLPGNVALDDAVTSLYLPLEAPQ